MNSRVTCITLVPHQTFQKRKRTLSNIHKSNDVVESGCRSLTETIGLGPLLGPASDTNWMECSHHKLTFSAHLPLLTQLFLDLVTSNETGDQMIKFFFMAWLDYQALN